MPEIRLDRSKPFSTVHGDRQPDDPHYQVHFWQGQKVNGVTVTLPFDAQGNLVPDDGKTAPIPGMMDGKPILYAPLYSAAMRELVQLKLKKMSQIEARAPATAEAVLDEDEDAGATDAVDEVNFQSWLRGQARYEWPLLQRAAKARYSKNFKDKKSLVEDLVLDEKLVPEKEVSAELARYLPAKE